jgi:1-deoxy-D-xylulose-5-phosphate reductoisomerase
VRHISILGSTGSIGQQTLDIVEAHRDSLTVEALAAGSKNLALLAQQIEKFSPKLVAVPDVKVAGELKLLLSSAKLARLPEIVVGSQGLIDAATVPAAQLVVTAVVGFLGLQPTIAAIKSGKDIALANKETLVAAGSLVMPLARQHKVQIIPVDSEHSAIFQSLGKYQASDVRQLLLTGSGGPFRTWTKEQIASATKYDALKHPNWSMGPKITIDSATLMNKGLEIIEARWLFHLPSDKIRVVIHPQSILHSAVEFVDGSIVGQMGLPDMRLPIHFALFYPGREASTQVPAMDFTKIASLTFEEPDYNRFACLKLAKMVADLDNTMPCVLNAANEIAVAAFLSETIGFCQIAETIERVLQSHKPVTKPDIESIIEADRWAREKAQSVLSVVARQELTVS